MTTYNSYEAAKIANPKSVIWASKLARYGRDSIFGTKVSLAELTNNYFKCNPADHSMTVDRFLADGHKFIEGDVFLNHDGDVVEIGKRYEDSIVITESEINRPCRSVDCRSFILRAAALETKEPKRTKVEYVKVDDTGFFELKGEFQARGIFFNESVTDIPDYVTAMDIKELAHHFLHKNLFRRIETPIEWWEDASELINQTDDDNCSSIMEGKLHVNATLTQDQWCDFARILLEQGE